MFKGGIKMTFQEILEYAEKGERIRRTEWGNKDFYIQLMPIEEYFVTRHGQRYLNLCLEDYRADDWKVCDNREYFDWNKALELMEQGKCVARKSWRCIDEGWMYLDSYEKDIFSKWYKDPESHGNYHILTRTDLKANDWYLV